MKAQSSSLCSISRRSQHSIGARPTVVRGTLSHSQQGNILFCYTIGRPPARLPPAAAIRYHALVLVPSSQLRLSGKIYDI